MTCDSLEPHLRRHPPAAAHCGSRGPTRSPVKEAFLRDSAALRLVFPLLSAQLPKPFHDLEFRWRALVEASVLSPKLSTRQLVQSHIASVVPRSPGFQVARGHGIRLAVEALPSHSLLEDLDGSLFQAIPELALQ